MEFDGLSNHVLECAIEVHREWPRGSRIDMRTIGGVKTELLVNFDVMKRKDGIKRFVL